MATEVVPITAKPIVLEGFRRTSAERGRRRIRIENPCGGAFRQPRGNLRQPPDRPIGSFGVQFFDCGRKRPGISVAQPDAAMEAHVPRSQVRLMAVMVILMWWSYIQWIRPVMLPSRHEQRLVFPPGALDPHNTYRHLFYPRARQEPVDRIPSAVPTRQTGQVA
jgi:hypothetical protein